MDKNNAVAVGVFSAICHELGHLSAMRLCKENVTDLKISLGRVDILRANKPVEHSFKREIFVLISGPIFNFLVAYAAVFFKQFLCGLGLYNLVLTASVSMGVINLLPIYFLDGGQILYLTLSDFYSEEIAKLVLNVTSTIFLAILLICAIMFIYLSGYNFSLLFIVVYLFLYYFFKK